MITPSPTANAQDVTATLTAAERETLNAAAAILTSRSSRTTNWIVCAGLHDGKPYLTASYFDTNGEQYSGLAGETFADKVALAVDTQQRVNADADGYKARRVEALKAELAALDVAA